MNNISNHQSLWQGTVIGAMLVGTIRVLTVTIGHHHLMVLTGTTGTSILPILIRAITITVLTGSLLGVSRTTGKVGI